ncbi:hypothetical protein F2Q68_00042373 [Brassica cretica]|uniref:Uncharacterized protein n=1 Tax=Brassica cretica TaxID=69181 RepID=A0A8S9MRI0_BRACR|nr:hypothetical protein F2Q68_00042373 [Brassica cretica]
MRVAWRFIGGFGQCLRFIGGSRWVSSLIRWLSSSIRWLSSSILSGSSRWPSLKNHGGYLRRIKFLALPEDRNRRLLLITIERWFYFFSQKERRHRTANSPISLLAKGSRRNRSKLLERFILSSQEKTSMLNQRRGEAALLTLCTMEIKITGSPDAAMKALTQVILRLRANAFDMNHGLVLLPTSFPYIPQVSESSNRSKYAKRDGSRDQDYSKLSSNSKRRNYVS